jgi:pyruvate formate lyase activating enzyme
MVFDIQKFSIHDGPGIRTTVFLKGCPLKCLWCHNPESQQSEQEISFMPEKCIGCGWCFKNCPQKGHVMENGKHVLHRELCIRCGKCTEKCYAGANTIIGREMTVEEVIAEVLKDKPFYETSNGGMTISGGEPMHQFKFTAALLAEAKKQGLHNCLETCGFTRFENLRKIMPAVDLFLYDLKETDPAKHQRYTGVSLQPILDNLFALDQAGAAICLRCPIVPGFNDFDEHFKAIATIANKMKNVLEINLMPYHPLGESKLNRLGKPSIIDGKTFADEKTVALWVKTVQDGTTVTVKKG